jgi:Amino acid synthesis
VTNIEPPVRKLFSQIEVVHSSAGRSDDGGPLRRVAVCAVIENPYAGQGYVEDLSALIGVSDAIGTLLGEEAARLLGEPVESYGKAGLVGTDGEQEHVNATVTSVFGDAFRKAIGGGDAWITSVTSRWPSRTRSGSGATTTPSRCASLMLRTRMRSSSSPLSPTVVGSTPEWAV